VVLRLTSGEHVQVDTVITFDEHVEWMKGRYVPERGVKGFVTGSLFKALGDYLKLTIGTEGVVARLKDGERVTSKQRAGVKYHKVSGDYRTFLMDIARYLLGDEANASKTLVANPGLDPGVSTVADLASGIVGLADTLAAAGTIDKRDMLNAVLSSFREGMKDSVARVFGL